MMYAYSLGLQCSQKTLGSSGSRTAYASRRVFYFRALKGLGQSWGLGLEVSLACASRESAGGNVSFVRIGMEIVPKP